MKKVLIFLVILLSSILIFIVLKGNKEKISFQTSLGQQKIEEIPVEVVKSVRGHLALKFSVAGKISAANEFMVVSQTRGKIVSKRRSAGDKVAKGEILVSVDDKLLQAEYEVAKAVLSKARTDLERFEVLQKGDAATAQQLENIKLNFKSSEAKVNALEEQLKNTQISSPVSGTINSMLVEVGSVIGPGQPICEVVNLNAMNMKVLVTEEELPMIKNGMNVVITTEVFPEQEFKGSVKRIAVKADRTLQYEVEIEIPNSMGKPLRSGMFARAIFNFGDLTGIIINKDWIVREGEKSYLFLIRNGAAVKTEIKTSKEINGKMVVEDGLSEEDEVVIQGQNIVEDGSRVRIVDR